MIRTSVSLSLQRGESAVVCVGRDTGIILCLDGNWAIGDCEKYRVFATADEAQRCALELVTGQQGGEVTVVDSEGTAVATFVGEPADTAVRLGGTSADLFHALQSGRTTCTPRRHVSQLQVELRFGSPTT